LSSKSKFIIFSTQVRKKYEKEIFETFRQAYPDAKISYNQKVIGRYSKIERQIDVLIEGRIAGKKLRLIIDGKYYSKNIDVKEVESFISMVEDVGAAQGILITSKGYSQAAINRAYYGPTDIELDILNFEELKRFQGFGGTITQGWYGAVIPAPFGWIIDGTRRENSIATLYQRGKTFEEAVINGEFIYANIWGYDEIIKNLDDVLKFHEEDTLRFHPTATFEYSDSIERSDNCRTLTRKILRKETDLQEYSGFVSFENFCVFCVLFTPEELSIKNIRKLEYIIERIIPVNVHLPSVAATEIALRERYFENAESAQEKAEILISIAQIHRDMKELDKAKEKYYQSIEIFPENYGAKLGLLEMGFNSENRDELIDDFYNVYPGNLQICDDLVRICIENDQPDLLEDFFDKKVKEHAGEFEKLGCIYFSWADLNYTIEQKEKALKYFKLAEENFTKCFDNNHPIVKKTKEAIRELENN
jgi:tetratricopeptide (TPR) repeat protein